ncbi:MAG: hypothetical protein F6K11_07365 [Leptolyngbya sp. SIO3F4]|nr:hypothetical protein [Leptolyngbya sp. SIO3F4]
MLGTLFKKKIREDQLADYFVNSVIHLVDEGFPEVVACIQTDASFVSQPPLQASDSDRFLFIVIAGNLKYIPQFFNDYQDIRLMEKIQQKFSKALDVPLADFKELMTQYQRYFSRINHPSKNTHYAMSKAVFFKYDLNDYQEDYFRNMKSPNPMLLKRLDDLMEHFIWKWEGILEKFRVSPD